MLSFTRSRVLAGAVTVAAVSALLLLAAPAAQADPAETAGLQYVALGDSYAAGFGITPGTGVPVPGCQQAEADYPHQVAAALGMKLTDVTCTGAVTANIVATPQVTAEYFGGGTADPQSTALSAETDVVTVSIGGNDAGFSEIAASCLALSATGPVAGPGDDFSASDCESIYVQDGVDALAQRITDTVAPSLAEAYATIRASAPNAKVFVVGYPSLFPDAANTPAGGCFTQAIGTEAVENAIPFTDIDVPYIHSIEVLLNQTIAEQAAAAGFAFIDNQPGSVAHSVCPQSASPYINGITVQSFTTQPYTKPGALHPNAAGVAYLTAQTAPVIDAAFPAPMPTPTPTPTPTAIAIATTVPAALAATGSPLPAALPLTAAAAVLLGLAIALAVPALRRRA